MLKILAVFAIAMFLHFSRVFYTYIIANEFPVASGIHIEKGMEMNLEMNLTRCYLIKPFICELHSSHCKHTFHLLSEKNKGQFGGSLTQSALGNDLLFCI